MASDPPRIDSMEPDMAAMKISKSYPLEFVYVKTLFLQQQYSQCISTCRQILDVDHAEQPRHPLEQTFMRLYLALAHDELARAMHHFSSAKLSAIAQAESLYREAAEAIPGLEDCNELRQYASILDEGHDATEPSLPQSTSRSTLNSEVLRRPPSPSPFLSPPTQAHSSLPNITSPEADISDAEDDLESHDSFGEIMTPQRMARLPSTFSSMSLLNSQKQANGLLRPVRPGSVAKPYQAPPKFTPSPKQYRSRLPRLNTASSLGSSQHTLLRQTSPVRKQLRAADEEWSPVASPKSPVSPLGSAYIGSDDMSISPLSPSTPVAEKAEDELALALPPSATETNPFVEHLEALRKQIQTHLDLLQEAKEAAVFVQTERMTKNNMRKLPATKASKLDGGMPQSRSFWLFTPQDVKIVEKQRRIHEGRQRLWARPRFDPSRYQGLAERALAEL